MLSEKEIIKYAQKYQIVLEKHHISAILNAPIESYLGKKLNLRSGIEYGITFVGIYLDNGLPVVELDLSDEWSYSEDREQKFELFLTDVYIAKKKVDELEEVEEEWIYY